MPGADRHVLMVVSNPYSFDPRVRREAESLVQAGMRVTVVGWDRNGEFDRTEEIEGVRVVRLRNTPWMRLLPFDLLRLRPWWRHALRAALEIHRDDPYDAVHSHDLDTLPTGVELKRRLGVPLIYDTHEIWGLMLARELPDAVANHFLRKEERLLDEVDRVVTVTEPMADHFHERTDAPVTIVYNAKEVAGSYQPPEDGFSAVYIGTLNPGRLIEEMIAAAGELDDVRLDVAGIGKPGFVGRVETTCQRTPGAAFHGRIPESEVLPRTRAAHTVVAMFHPDNYLARYGLPNKLFEAMACGRPILVTEGTYLGRFVEDHGVGAVAEPTVEGIRDGLARLRDDPEAREAMGRRGIERSRDRFNWPAQAETLVELYDEML